MRTDKQQQEFNAERKVLIQALDLIRKVNYTNGHPEIENMQNNLADLVDRWDEICNDVDEVRDECNN